MSTPAAPLAAIDLGSNSFRLEIGRIEAGRYKRIDYLKETVRLGAGLDAEGRLGEDAAQRGFACLARFAERLQGFPRERVRAAATQTLREARNRDDFLVRGERVLGWPIEVVSGREEARLIYAGVARLQPSTLPRLVVDIGGRSTEMIFGRGERAERAESYQVGSVSLSMAHFADGRFTAEGFRQAQVAAGAVLDEAAEAFAGADWREALGSSGTAGAVAQVLVASRVAKDGAITPQGLRWLIERCLEAGRFDKLELPGLRDDRRAVIGGGLAILYTLCARLGIESLKPARGALRQGVIFDLAERLAADERDDDADDRREATVRELQRRFGVDSARADRVSALAASLRQGLAPPADAEARRELRWAADLHEAGMMVSHHDHHRHSAYLVGHVDAAGFSQTELRRVADLVLGQRGGLKKLEPQLQSASFAADCFCLRVAVIVGHAPVEPAPDEVTAHTGVGGAPELVVGADWAAGNAPTLLLLLAEVEAWRKSRALAPTLVVA